MTQHAPYVSPVNHLQVSAAREYLAAGFTLKEAARQLGVMASDLDQGLWQWFGESFDIAPKRYEADFVA